MRLRWTMGTSARPARLLAATMTAALLVAACSPASPAPPPAPKTEAKPTTAPAVASPAASPVASPAAAASPAASPMASPAAAAPSPMPAASPADSPSPAAAGSAAGRVTATHALPDLPIAQFQNAKLPGSVSTDRKLLLGGVGSDLWHDPGAPSDEFWMVTDRGPNGLVPVEGQQRRTFPIPEFTPTIIKVKAAGGTVTVLEQIPILGQSGRPVTGLSNLEKIDEAPYDYKAATLLQYNPSGLDTEGLVRAPNGEFWLAEEYSPSIVRVDATGKVLKRFVPEGLKLVGADYPVVEALPAIYNKRKINRGFEGLGLSPDGKTLFVALQSPLLNPDAPTGNASRMTRILAFDIATEKAVAEYAYRFEPVAEFDTTAARPATEMKLSGVVALSPTTLLVLERTDWVAKLYRVDLAQATNILGTKWNDPATSPTLEAVTDPASVADLKILPKTLQIALNELPGVPDKIEGIAVLDRATLVIANDNDFDIGTVDGDGNNVGTNAKSRLLYIALTSPLP
jgi:hypothetical protein